jgi:hypothetical protein
MHNLKADNKNVAAILNGFGPLQIRTQGAGDNS